MTAEPVNREALARIIDPVAHHKARLFGQVTEGAVWVRRNRRALEKADEILATLSRSDAERAEGEALTALSDLVHEVADVLNPLAKLIADKGEGSMAKFDLVGNLRRALRDAQAVTARLKSPLTRPQPVAETVEAAITDEMVGEAMLDAWNEICSDTECHPQDINQLGRRRLEFRPCHWADLTAMRLRGLVAALRPSAHGEVG
jgi:hypothetical protein